MKHQPRKRFGQNFLTDTSVIEKIVASINPQPGEVMVEIGPGQAALTLPLMQSGVDLHVVEIDRDLCESLLKRFPGKFQLHQQDALKTDFASIVSGQKFRLVGNLPYNISTPLIFHLFQWSQLMTDMYFMLQKEVVDRMAAEPGGKDYGRLSVMSQFYCQVSPLFVVKPGAFYPPPKVDSRIVRLVPHQKPPVDIPSEKIFAQVVRQAFSQRRKTLRNCLKSLLTENQIKAADVDPGLRAERLHLQDFARLSHQVKNISD